VIYLLCFDRPFKHARHYLGFVDGGEEQLKKRIERHKKGGGARLVEVITAAGIGFEVARTWEGDRHFERSLKKRKSTPKLCPICRAREGGGRNAKTALRVL
jgi:hypothetical protein